MLLTIPVLFRLDITLIKKERGKLNILRTTPTMSIAHFFTTVMGLGPKWLTLIGFVIQSVILLVVFRACSLEHAKHPSDEYIASTVVVFTELTKLLVSLICCFYFDAQGKWSQFLDVMIRAFVDDGIDILKLCLPALLYAVQNNLQYVIETAPLFLVLYQSKIVTTAIFFTHMLAKRLSIKEWMAIILLALGVSMVESSQHDILPHHASNIVGLLAVIIACITSGFAGVYYEKVLKSSRSSIWVINIQLSMMSFSFSTILAMSENPEEIIKYGVFKGFNIFVLIIVVLQALTGLAVALVVKYADNIHKGFSASIAIVIASIIDYFLFDDIEFNLRFAMGSFLVMFSSVGYLMTTHSEPGHTNLSSGGINASTLTSVAQPSQSSTSNHETDRKGLDIEGGKQF